jgi:hypothetical protein
MKTKSEEKALSKKRKCERCAVLNLSCCRFKVVLTVSDMVPSYEKYGKSVPGIFEELLLSPTHVHDISHSIKNAEASLERGTHFNGHSSNDAEDLAVLITSIEDDLYLKLIEGLSHKAVLQFDKQSDEQSL